MLCIIPNDIINEATLHYIKYTYFSLRMHLTLPVIYLQSFDKT